MPTVVVLTNKGRDIATARVGGLGSFGVPQYVGWGTGAGTAAAGDTDLFTAASEARVTGTVSQQTTTVTNDTLQVQGTLTANAGKTITNAGVFDAAGTGSPPTGGNLFIKVSHDGIALNAGDSIQYTFKWQLT